MDVLGRIIGFIVVTFLVAFLYGFLCATVDCMRSSCEPVSSGRRAAENIYNLFGTVSEEARKNDAASDAHPADSTMRKIASPYAVTADVTAILTGKIEAGISAMLHPARGGDAK